MVLPLSSRLPLNSLGFAPSVFASSPRTGRRECNELGALLISATRSVGPARTPRLAGFSTLRTAEAANVHLCAAVRTAPLDPTYERQKAEKARLQPQNDKASAKALCQRAQLSDRREAAQPSICPRGVGQNTFARRSACQAPLAMIGAIAATSRRIRGLATSGSASIRVPSVTSREKPLQTRVACCDAAGGRKRSSAVFQHEALARSSLELGIALGSQQLIGARVATAHQARGCRRATPAGRSPLPHCRRRNSSPIRIGKRS